MQRKIKKIKKIKKKTARNTALPHRQPQKPTHKSPTRLPVGSAAVRSNKKESRSSIKRKEKNKKKLIIIEKNTESVIFDASFSNTPYHKNTKINYFIKD